MPASLHILSARVNLESLTKKGNSALSINIPIWRDDRDPKKPHPRWGSCLGFQSLKADLSPRPLVWSTERNRKLLTSTTQEDLDCAMGQAHLSLHSTGSPGPPRIPTAGCRHTDGGGEQRREGSWGFWLLLVLLTRLCCCSGRQDSALVSLQLPFQSCLARQWPLPFPTNKGAATHQDQLSDREDTGRYRNPVDPHCSGQDTEAVVQRHVEKGWEFGKCFYNRLRNPLNFQPHSWGSGSHFWALKWSYSYFSLHNQKQN